MKGIRITIEVGDFGRDDEGNPVGTVETVQKHLVSSLCDEVEESLFDTAHRVVHEVLVRAEDSHRGLKIRRS